MLKKYEKGTLVHISDNLFEWVLDNNKQSSHQRLQAMLVQQEKIFQSTVYRKSEVEMIYKAFGVSFWQPDTKAKLSEKLVEKIQASEHILHPYLDDSGQGQQPGPSAGAATPRNATHKGILQQPYKVYETVYYCYQ